MRRIESGKKITISSNDQLPLLKTLEDQTEELIIENCDNLSSLRKLPKNLRILRLINCRNLREISNLANTNLSLLEINSCPQLEECYPNLPQNLQTIELLTPAAEKIRFWPFQMFGLPFQLKFDLSACSIDLNNEEMIWNISKLFRNNHISKLPQGLSEVNRYPNIDQQYRTLVIEFDSNSKIPDYLLGPEFNFIDIAFDSRPIEVYSFSEPGYEVDLSSPELVLNYTAFCLRGKFARKLENLFFNLNKELRIKDSSFRQLPILSFPQYPDLPVIRKLSIANCRNFESIEGFDPNLQELKISNCPNFITFPESFHDNFQTLSIENCVNFIPTEQNLSRNLKSLTLSNCNLRSLEAEVIPPNLERLVLADRNLQTLPLPLPNSLIFLNIRETGIAINRELRAELEKIEERGGTVIYPQIREEQRVLAPRPAAAADFLMDMLADEDEEKKAEVITKFDTIIALYNSKNPQPISCPKLQVLLNRLLTENLGSRGGLDVVIEQTINPVFDKLEKHHEILPLLENLTPSDHEDSCINQPVEIWSELSAWIHVVAQNNIADKIDAAKFAMTIERMKCFMNPERYGREMQSIGLSKHEKPGEIVEVEFANALLREVHKRFLAQGIISKPWIGISNAIAYESAISSKLTPAVIDRACAYISAEISDPHKLQNFLLETNAFDIWKNFVLSKSELKNIEVRHRKFHKVCLLACEKREFDEEDRQLLEDPLCKKYYDDLCERNLTPDGFDSEFKTLEMREKSEIIELAKSKMSSRRPPMLPPTGAPVPRAAMHRASTYHAKEKS